jgi:hypothetical protein
VRNCFRDGVVYSDFERQFAKKARRNIVAARKFYVGRSGQGKFRYFVLAAIVLSHYDACP